MAEYIEREAAIEEAIDAVDEWSGGYNPHRAAMIRDGINTIPAADVTLARHGRWMTCKPYNPEFNGYKCSECGARYQGFSPDNYCPNCGAKMDKEVDNGRL